MRLHRVLLRNFRGVAEREVVLADQGLTVIDGPNEAGKSSIGDALDMVLRLPDSSTAREVRDAVPAGQDVGPYVEVEMSTGPYRFVIAKQWSRGRMTSLDVLAPQRLQMTGREAHQWVQSTLSDTLDTDLWDALRVAQGSADGPVDVHTRSLARVLDGSMGVDDTGGDEDLIERIDDERSLYWTRTGRPRGERVELARELQTLDERAADLEHQLVELVEAAARVDELTLHRAELVARRGPAEAALAAARRRAEALDAARRQLADVEATADAARAAHRSADEAVARRREAVDDVASATDEVDKLVADLERSAAVADAARAGSDAASARLAAIDAELAEVTLHLAAADAERTRQVDAERLASLRARLAEVDDASVRADDAVATLTVLAPVDAEALSRIERASTAVITARARLEGASTHVAVRALSDLAVSVGGTPHQLNADDTVEATASARLGIVVPGQVEVTVSPADGAADLAAQVVVAQAALADACGAVSVGDLDEARQVHARRVEAERIVAEARADQRRALGSATVVELRADAERLELRLAAEPRQQIERSARDLDASVDVLRDRQAELALRRSDQEADLRHHEQRVEAAQRDDMVLDGRIDQARRQVERLNARLTAARDEVVDDALDGAAHRALAALESAEMALAGARRAVVELCPDDIEAELVRRVADLDHLDAELAGVVAEIDRIQTRLDVSGEQGLAGALDEVRTRREHVGRRHDQLERRAAAALHLHDLVTSHRDEARRRYAAPYRRELERLGRLVFGEDLQIELDDDLRVERRVLGGVSLGVAQLSVGAREQLGLLARLACAAIVSGDGGAPVMFDDVLGHADPDRVEAMGRALEAAADGSQIIITTCTPERYATIDARRVSLR